ncbi:HNH endonuclease [Diaphorobacter aerolatus]|uniref:HNH endonuclease n=1 Tax=Diaphorobacter aerolatus TaxID=1288495 RepID=A0A7H0GJC6_9BURK|nr:HNH endonuclease [Diaphorobacter aerolatus]QNP48392.1 HNH endonuclease [Diaphorobacter aerolatus]
MVPFTMHGANVRSRISSEEWKKVCKVVHKQAGLKHHCQICRQSGKDQGFEWPVECHEKWHYDDKRHTQTLTGMLSLCPMCHKAKHYGLAVKQGYERQVRKHLMRVNRWSEAQLDVYISESMATVKERSAYTWTLDLTYLNNYEYSFLGTEFTENEKSNCSTVVFY